MERLRGQTGPISLTTDRNIRRKEYFKTTLFLVIEMQKDIPKQS